jgi:polysaccharide export outer membrane protein
MINKLLRLAFLLLLSSCGSTRNLVYFNDLKDTRNYKEEIKNSIEPRIQPDDQLSIVVSSLNPESNMLFNSGVMPSTSGTAVGGASTSAGTGRTTEGYLVDKSGFINFPVLGKVKLSGLTKEEATTKMTAEINKNIKNPIVNIRFLNFRITVIGEVNKPSTFLVPSEHVNILEAIGLAGDLTPYGKRENILIIREQNGVRTATRVDLASRAILNSPDFYLQQNDVVYVEPAKIKALQGSSSTFYLSLATASVSILSLLVVFLR